jgi:hypothetical protein
LQVLAIPGVDTALGVLYQEENVRVVRDAGRRAFTAFRQDIVAQARVSEG